ncbi:dTDP-glucose 4,6-dehydratase [candidate division WOR-1 bacterium RIFOXYA12_FULL_43_27]|uniref:dTDP-glucose 4,6-dehydratase n=1 Tax=candidate division WOR-1 bacterium RIFOXYC2_FULL_46_14 TaxID=1802587 RepID=A0A1F4U5H7_UNCSA|nr:MAG: dTDP-glucose 4,6-dehydratase [candidate division WOR-1 bacterium RIFOXYA12_FULL_43_27]OGC20130.1 MAG: dTDP-glucose 4,6-dehydratase [candidate division WOR-1 bacterium RIFOXYB2_FULL_46_45]OGC32133.1 MAG: dTDP-glucose 4,6-dehydratase [candidate division WOR-1 bacterium RIFOXYA2_FULL_46_56]OGC39533.1 MAG: dTDP-glucose 4,6-dehydratase [candidate division WOR-1 bacterium RIFOXYC2_FULL_46_14]
MKKILVTGGAGFIGSNFVRYLVTTYPELEVVNLDKLTYAGNLDNLKDINENPRYRFIKGDIGNKNIVEKLAGEGLDAIVNFAAETHVDRSILDPEAFIKTDIMGTHILLEVVRKFNIKRYIQISTDEVYGSIAKGSFTEKSPIAPNSPYSSSKAGGDLLVRSYFKTYGTPVIITRSSNNFGPYQYPEKIIPFFITQAIYDQKLPLYGDGKNVRNWLQVVDNCRAIDAVLRRGKDGEVYNIGGAVEVENIKIAKAILRKLGKSTDLLKFVTDRPGHDRRYSLDSSKVKKLGWKPSLDFEKDLNDTIDWYINHRKWWEKIIKKQKSFQSFKESWYKTRQ